MSFKFSYRNRMILAIAVLSVFLTATCIVFYYRYTYGIVIDSISKNLKDVAGIYRASLDDEDIARIKRLRMKIEPLIRYSKADLDYMKRGGINNFLPKEAVARLQSDPDFIYLDKKFEKMMMTSIHPSSPQEAVFDNNKLFEYPERGLIGVCIIFSAEKYAKYNIVQTIVSTAYRPIGPWPGNSTGTSWKTPVTRKTTNNYEIYVPSEPYKDKFYTSLYALCPITDKGGHLLANFEIDYPAGNELEKLSRLRMMSYILASVSLLLGVIIAFGFSVRMSESLKKLVNTANRIKNNDYSAKVDIPRQDEFGMLGNVFNQMSDAVNTTTTNLRESNERLRSLTADMHDGVGAVLASIQIASRNDSGHGMEAVGRLADQGMGEIRFLMDAMEYDQCTFELLKEGVSLLAVDILQPNGVKWELEAEGDAEKEIPFRMYLDVQRIAREAFTNIIKHSMSKNCVTKLKISDSELNLTVESDGERLAEPVTASGGRGLKNMSYRVDRYGGSVTAEQKQPGFRLLVIVKMSGQV